MTSAKKRNEAIFFCMLQIFAIFVEVSFMEFIFGINDEIRKIIFGKIKKYLISRKKTPVLFKEITENSYINFENQFCKT